MIERDFLERIDRHLARSDEHMGRGNECMARGNELMKENRQAFQDLRTTLRELNVRSEKVTGEMIAELRRLGDEVSAGREENRRWHEEADATSRTQRQALLRILNALRRHDDRPRG